MPFPCSGYAICQDGTRYFHGKLLERKNHETFHQKSIWDEADDPIGQELWKRSLADRGYF